MKNSRRPTILGTSAWRAATMPPSTNNTDKKCAVTAGAFEWTDMQIRQGVPEPRAMESPEWMWTVSTAVIVSIKKRQTRVIQR